MTKQRKKIATIISLTALLLILLASYYARHVIVDDNCLGVPAAAVEYRIDDQHYSWDNARQVQLAVIAPVFCVFAPPVAYICAIVLAAYPRTSHIQYCGKKMVRAIMLQFRPN